MASKTKTPTVSSQVKSAEAPKGSALEKLIHENQNFDILSTEEIEDDYGHPLWLRVYWRKQHPEITLPEKNPGAAYPEVLSQIYKRMKADPTINWEAAPSKYDPPTK